MAVNVAVVDSGSGNLRSVARALEVAGATATITSDPDAALRADKLVMPGQGSFKACADAIAASGMSQAIAEFIGSGRDYFGICLGMQMLLSRSEEGPADGMGLIPGQVVKFRPTPELRVPHIGWNSITATAGERMFEGAGESPHYYFLHSYYAVPDDDAAIAATCDYGGGFAASLRVDNVFACQFHPEKSQRLGLRLLANFISGEAG